VRLRARIASGRAWARERRRGEIGGLTADSSWVAVWSAATALADFAQIALVTHVLGLQEFGRLSLVFAFTYLVGQFFDVRVSVAATTFGARELARDPARAGATFRFSYLIDAATGVVAFIIVVGLSFLVGPHLVGDEGTLLISLFGLALLAATVEDSSMSLLRLLDRYKLVATYSVVLETLRVGLVAIAVFVFEDLVAVVIALLLQKALLAGAHLVAASRAFQASTGQRLAGRDVSPPDDVRRGMVRTVFSTNAVSYARLAQTQLTTVVVGAIGGATQAGLYRVGMTPALALGKLLEPAYIALLPRLSRLFAAGHVAETRALIRRLTFIAAPTITLILCLLLLFSHQALTILGGTEATAAASVLLFGAIAQAVNGVFFWNDLVAFAAGRAGSVARVAVATMLVQVALLAPLVSALDAEGGALAFMVTTLIANLAITWIALRALRA
jgi:O-antigen/teichoic acid export membrane protein